MHMYVCVAGEGEGVGSDAGGAKHREEQAWYGVFALLMEIGCCVYFFWASKMICA